MAINLETAEPIAIQGYLSETIRKALGDKIQNASSVSATRGRYSVVVVLDKDQVVEFKNFRRSAAKKIAKAIRALK